MRQTDAGHNDTKNRTDHQARTKRRVLLAHENLRRRRIPVTTADYAERTDGLRTDGVELTGRRPDGVALRVFARPSGTEPKLKYYGQLSAPVADGSVSTVHHELSQLLDDVLAELPAGRRGEEIRR